MSILSGPPVFGLFERPSIGIKANFDHINSAGGGVTGPQPRPLQFQRNAQLGLDLIDSATRWVPPRPEECVSQALGQGGDAVASRLLSLHKSREKVRPRVETERAHDRYDQPRTWNRDLSGRVLFSPSMPVAQRQLPWPIGALPPTGLPKLLNHRQTKGTST